MTRTRQIFADNMRRITEGCCMTDLAKELGVTRQALYTYFNGVVPSADVLDRISDYFDVETYELIKEK